MPPFSRDHGKRKKSTQDRACQRDMRTWRRKAFLVEERVAEEEREQCNITCGKRKSKKSGEKDDRKKSKKETKLAVNIKERNGRKAKRSKDMAGF